MTNSIATWTIVKKNMRVKLRKKKEQNWNLKRNEGEIEKTMFYSLYK